MIPKPRTRHLVYIPLAILLTSCRFGSPVWKVTSGGPGETYAAYNNGEVVSSNVISYTVFRPGQRIKENRLKISRPTESFKYVQRKPQYPDVNVSKSFVKTNVGNLLVDIIVYAGWLPSGGRHFIGLHRCSSEILYCINLARTEGNARVNNIRFTRTSSWKQTSLRRKRTSRATSLSSTTFRTRSESTVTR